MSDVNALMKRCQIGTRNYAEANDLHAECYGMLGKLQAEVERLRKEVEEQINLRARLDGQLSPQEQSE